MFKKIIFTALLFGLNSFAQEFDYKNYGQFLKKYVSENGNVNYDKVNSNKPELELIVNQFIKNIPSTNWSKNDKMAYYINLYNVFTIKTIIDNYPVKSIKDINNVWDNDFILLGKKMYSLGDIEHKILRKMGDPRVHFAINCASFSCPKINNDVYLDNKLDKQLDAAAREFINDNTKNVITKNELKLSNIFNWFADDFKTQGTIIDFLNEYSKTKIDKKAKIKFLEYNWALNK